MLLQKSRIKGSSIPIGVIGLLCAIIGNLFPETMLQKDLYLAAGVLLLFSAIIEKEEYFISLEIVVVFSTLLAYLPEHLLLKTIAPLLLSLLSIGFLYWRGRLNSGITIVGVIGLAFLGLGYATLNPLIYLCAGLLLTAYSSTIYYRGVRIALLWAVLNGIFSFTALLTLV